MHLADQGSVTGEARAGDTALNGESHAPRITIRGVTLDLSCLALGTAAAVAVYSTTLTPILAIPLALCASVLTTQHWRFGIVDGLAVGFFVLSALSLTWTATEVLTSQHVLRTGGALTLFIAFRLGMQCRRQALAVAFGYLVGCGLALYALWRQVGPAGWRADLTNSLTIEGLNSNYVAYALSAGVAATAILLAGRKGALLLAAFTIFALIGGVLLTSGRGGLLGILLALAWWLVPAGMRATTWKVMIFTVTIVAVSVSIGLLDDALRRVFPPVLGVETGDLNGRLSAWPIARGLTEENLLLGVGAGSFPQFNPRQIYAHNALLDVSSGLGLVGVIVFVALLGAVVHQGSTPSGPVGRHLCVVLVVLVLTPPLVSGYWYMSPAIWVILALCSRIAIVFPAHERTSTGT